LGAWRLKTSQAQALKVIFINYFFIGALFIEGSFFLSRDQFLFVHSSAQNTLSKLLNLLYQIAISAISNCLAPERFELQKLCKARRLGYTEPLLRFLAPHTPLDTLQKANSTTFKTLKRVFQSERLCVNTRA